MSQFYHQCQRYHGQVVTVKCRDGSNHSGRIVRVSPSHVYIQPTGKRNLGGFGMGFYGGFYGGYSPIAVPLAFVTGIVLGGLLFW